MEKLKAWWGLTVRSFVAWNRNDSYARSATVAYYALFSFPSLLIIVVNIAGNFYGEAAIQGRISRKIEDYVGTDTAAYVEEILANVTLENKTFLTIVIGLGVLFISATGVFFQLKMALNNIWNVTEKSQSFLVVLKNRLISFGMIMVLGFLLLIFLILSTILTIVGDVIQEEAPNITAFMLYLLDFVISFGAISALFAAVFKILPDVVLRWKVAFVGACLTTFLFLIGEYALGFYFTQSSPGNLYGGASSVVILLVWVYYNCLILFFGAEFTVQYALYKSEKVVPAKNAEPAIYAELKKLKNKKIQLEEEKRMIDTLKKNTSQGEEDEEEAKKEKES